MQGDLFSTAFHHIPDSLSVWSEPLKRDVRQIPLQIALDTDKDLWTLLQEDQDGMENFSQAMKAVAAGGGGLVDHALNGFDWKALGCGTVVDLGGGNGHVSIAIAKACPDLKIIVQDLPGNQEAARSNIPSDLQITGRVTFMAHDFFQPQPVTDAKVFFLRLILHDWRDDACLVIIQSLLPGMRMGARLLVMDRVLATPTTLTANTGMNGRYMDLAMFGTTGGGERSLDQWNDLFVRADPRLKIVAHRQPLGADHAVMEIELQKLSEEPQTGL